MRKFSASLTALAVTLALGACSSPQTSQTSTPTEAMAQTAQTQHFDNVLLQEFPGPYGGVPQFDKMKVEDIKPALEEGMALNLKEIDEIANNPQPPTFENTIVAMERSVASSESMIR